MVTIPPDFPLDAGWPPDASAGERETLSGPVTLDLCGVEPWTVPEHEASRRLVLNAEGRYRARTIVLHSGAADAEEMLDAVAAESENCSRTMSEVGTWLYTDVRRTDDGVRIRRWFDEGAFDEEPGCYSMDLYRTGNAVLVSEDSGVGIGKACANTVGKDDARDIKPALAAMQVFDLNDDNRVDAPRKTTDTWVVDELTGFSTAGGNIGCHIDSESVRCDIAQRDWEPPPAPASCDLDWGSGIVLDGNGKARFVCAGDTALNDENPLHAGRAIRSGDLTCRAGAESVRCVYRGSEHGFVMDGDSYKLF